MVYKFFPDKYGVHSKVIELVGHDKEVLDVGCATGYIAEQLVKNGCTVVGVEANTEAAEIARGYCDDIIIKDLDEFNGIPYEERYFDSILLMDILEHLKDPIQVLNVLKKYLKDEGSIYVSIPNIANWKVRASLLIGKFEYQKSGILDKTHLRFFNLKNAKELIRSAGFKIIEFDVSSGVPMAAKMGKAGYKISRLWPSLFALQFIIVAQKNELS